MCHILKTTLLITLIALCLTACKKTQEDSADAARETIAAMKASTIDAASEAAAKAERAASDIAKAADVAGASASGDEAADK